MIGSPMSIVVCVENGPHPVRIHWVKDSGTGPDGACTRRLADEPKAGLSAVPENGVGRFGQRRNLDAGESPFAYPKILSCMTRTGPGSMRENFAVTD
jgi:hypothetical protein